MKPSVFYKIGISFPGVFSYVKECKTRMMSPLVNVCCNHIKEPLDLAVKLLRDGQIISLPTDTVYGIAADAQNTQAIKKLYEIKSRVVSKPLAICVGDPEDVCHWCNLNSNVSNDLLRSLLPGPVTLVLERKPHLNPELNPGIMSVGIRVPNHSFVRELACKLGSPLALTSANVSSEQSSLSVTEFFDMWKSLGAVFDGGNLGSEDPITARLGSTVVDLVIPGHFQIIRPGCALQNTVSVLKDYGLLEYPS